RLISVLTKPLVIQQNHLVISTSIGISVFPDDGETPEVLLKHADTAMYRAKEAGRNSYCFYNSQMGERSYADLALEHRLRIALNDHSLYLVYQPKIDAAANELYIEDQALAAQFLTDYSCNMANWVVDYWKEFGNFLLVKYLDGNVKQEKDGEFLRNPWGYPQSPMYPGYPEEWKRNVVKKTSDKFLMK
ncbi:MAG: diguanylate cyclase, partial [Erysipelotrichia bacterium]|nr:diguanylate cyclase [Erysipelotrichia bacterium]